MGRIKRRITVSGDSLYVADSPSGGERIGTDRGAAKGVLGDVPRKSYTVVYTEAPKRGRYRVLHQMVGLDQQVGSLSEHIFVCFLPRDWRGRINRRVIR